MEFPSLIGNGFIYGNSIFDLHRFIDEKSISNQHQIQTQNFHLHAHTDLEMDQVFSMKKIFLFKSKNCFEIEFFVPKFSNESIFPSQNLAMSISEMIIDDHLSRPSRLLYILLSFTNALGVIIVDIR